ncbi:HECT-domain-containing protein [Cristinia sonorae]|uniref:HECT-type E3 ubiquitin transferase n=1 Tax=Cristinia sonorae TaxID=1940300 RepID=A0A8K0XL79_9AGAR|nr:HECT-domain-containing protein [Cristinia sonorae]
MSTPLFGGDTRRRREINLGGSMTASTSSSILQDAKARRAQREHLKLMEQSATRIQACWRCSVDRRRVKEQLKQRFEEDITSTTGLRCLVLIGRDEEVLGKWSGAVVSAGEDRLSHSLSDPSWIALLPRAMLLLLESVAINSQSQHAANHVAAVSIVVSRSVPVLSYLLRHGYYTHLSRAISNIPVRVKSTSPVLPTLVSLLVCPYTILDSMDDPYKDALQDFVTAILTIPLLPNRLPVSSLTFLAPRIPLSALHSIDVARVVAVTSLEQKIHLLANLCAFAPPRYSSLSAEALTAYLNLTLSVMSSLPVHALESPKSNAQPSVQPTWSDGSDSEHETLVTVVDNFSNVRLPELDSKTQTRLQTLPSLPHLNSLLQAVHRHRTVQPTLFSWCVALSNVWPKRRDKLFGAMTLYGGGGLVRELYRSHVRPSSLGQDVDSSTLTSPAHAAYWPPLLFLVELYTQALLTMGDDEFFSTGTTQGAPRNPLTVDELKSFSRQLLNIAFTLYWREDQTTMNAGVIPGQLSLKWESVRQKITDCLQAIHTRDSRRPFVPPEHWLVTAELDMGPFIDAAIYEERHIENPEGSRPLSKRQIAALSPRLGVLNNIPFAIPFETRVSIFRSFIQNDAMNRGFSRYSHQGISRITVRRESIAQDGFDRLQGIDLKGPIAITFIDQFGQEEAGIDGGGVFKEFLTALCKEVFDSDRGLWLATKNNELYPNPHSYAIEAHSLNWYRFIGRILGKALYEGILVDVAFAGFFLAKWLGKQSFLDDLASLDPELYQGLIFLKHYTGNPEDLSLNFTVAEEEFGVTKSRPLIPNGENIAVTKENRLQYIYLVSHYRLNKQIRQQSDAFFDGLSEMIDAKWLRMFNQQELQILLGGVNAPIDLDDLRRNTKYGGLYSDQDPTIQKFWNVVNSFDHEQRRLLLRFATSCSRPPLLGFKELVPNFAIRDSGSDQHRLPTASTCVNLLKLPRYTTERTLREKLLQAINSNAGFDLS